MFFSNSIGMDMGWIISLIRIIKDEETFGNLNGFTRNSIGLRDIGHLFFIARIT